MAKVKTVMKRFQLFRITCDNGKKVNIVDAAFGRSDAVTCPKNGAMANQKCKASNSVEKVRKR